MRPDKAADWIMRGMAGAERISSNEQAMIEKIEVMNGGRFGTKFKRIDGNFCLFNWHKHPDGLPHPSSMDIRDSAINVGFPSSPTRLMWSWGIVTVIDKIPETRTPNTLYLTSREFGGERNYQITFWKLRRGETHVSPVNISRV